MFKVNKTIKKGLRHEKRTRKTQKEKVQKFQ